MDDVREESASTECDTNDSVSVPEVSGSDTTNDGRSSHRLRTGRLDLLNGPLRPTVFRLALPVLCQQLLSFLVGFFDTFLSGRIDAVATSAIGFGSYVGWLASMMFGLVGTGTMAIVARHWGAGEYASARKAMNVSMRLAMVIGVIVPLGIFVFSSSFADVLGLPSDAARIVIRYLRIDAGGLFFMALLLVGSASLRGTGDMKTPLYVLGLVNVINVAVSTALVYGPGPIPAFGIDGIVAGTVTARVIGGVLMVLLLIRGVSGLQLDSRIDEFVPFAKRILRIGIPAAIEGAVMWGGQLMFLLVITRLDEGRFAGAVFAAHVVGVQIEAITYLPAVAYGQASAALVGQSLGANQPQRAVSGGNEALKQCLLLGAVITVVFVCCASQIYELMHNDPAVAAAGVPAFRLVAFVQMPLMVIIVYTFSLRGAGDTRFPLFITAFGLMCVRLPLACLFGIYFVGGLRGAWMGMCVDILVRSALTAWRFRDPRWLSISL